MLNADGVSSLHTKYNLIPLEVFVFRRVSVFKHILPVKGETEIYNQRFGVCLLAGMISKATQRAVDGGKMLCSFCHFPHQLAVFSASTRLYQQPIRFLCFIFPPYLDFRKGSK